MLPRYLLANPDQLTQTESSLKLHCLHKPDREGGVPSASCKVPRNTASVILGSCSVFAACSRAGAVMPHQSLASSVLSAKGESLVTKMPDSPFSRYFPGSSGPLGLYGESHLTPSQSIQCLYWPQEGCAIRKARLLEDSTAGLAILLGELLGPRV